MEKKKEIIEVKVPPPISDKSGNIAEDIRLIIAEWLSKVHIRYKTEYSTGGVAHTISLIQTRKSSKELVEILKARMPEMEEIKGLDKISKFLE